MVDEDEFAKTLIPELFKHNNYASFVRQLNMYGFHKRVGLSDNSMKASERKNKSPSEYYNPYFKRGHPNLLWLINKPKNGSSKSKAPSKRLKTEDGDADSDDDGKDGVEEIYRENMPGTSRALSQAPEAGPVSQRRELAVVHNQLNDIQTKQVAISQALHRLQQQHKTMYNQALDFKTLHERHENSINAILTFLATVYHRNLDGNVPQNLAQLFSNGIQPHDQQHQGNVVELNDAMNQQQPPGSMSPQRRQQRLLMAPPATGQGRANTLSPRSSSATPKAQSRSTPKSGTVEELFESAHSPSDSPSIKPEPPTPTQSQNMLDLIHNTNSSRPSPDVTNRDFDHMLTQYENANGQSPLSDEVRSSMLNMIASSSSASGGNNALVSPTPPSAPNFDDIGLTQQELENLLQLQSEQDNKIANVKNSLPPLSTDGDIPGMMDNSHFYNTSDMPDLDTSAANLDLDQYLDPGAFYNGSSPGTGADFGEFGGFGGDGNVTMSDGLDFGMDGVAGGAGVGVGDGNGSRITEEGSEVNTPDNGGDAGVGFGGEGNSPSKKRRKN